MVFRLKFPMTALLAVLVMGVFFVITLPVTALAHEFIIEGKGEGVKISSLKGSSGPNTAYATINGGTVYRNCDSDYTIFGIVIARFGCGPWMELRKEGRPEVLPCTYSEDETEEMEGELVGTGEYKEKGAKAEETFAEITIEKCGIEGKYKIKGSELCTIPRAFEENVVHEFICTPGGSKLIFKGESKGEKIETTQYSFSTELGILESGKKWSSS
jgi:hypothetical protein